MEKQYARLKDISKIEKQQGSQKQAIISIEIDTNTHFMHYNARE